MNKLIVVFLGVLVGSIIPTGGNNREEVLGLAIVLILGNIITECFFQREKMRYLSLLLSSATIGVLTAYLFQNWNKVAQIITLVIFAIASILITILMGRKEEKKGKSENMILDVFRKNEDEMKQ